MTTEGVYRISADQQEGVPTAPARRLERVFGKPSPEWTVDDIVLLARDQEIRLVTLMHIASDGWLKTLDFAPRSPEHLRDILEGGERADGSSLFAGTGIPSAASDILLRPRVSSAFLDPFSATPSLALLCGHAGRDGRPLPESPDTIVRAADARLQAELGLELWALGEVEYFLGKRFTEEDIYGADDRGYHASSPFVFGESLRRRSLTALAEIGVPIKYGHSEVGYIAPSDVDDTIWEQHEIELALAPLPEAAEHVALSQWVLRNLAHQMGMRCSFDPIMRKGHAGSGLHFHFSPVRDGWCVTRKPDGELSEPGERLLAGLVLHGAALMAFGNRRAGSFIRINQAKEAPSFVAWGAFDRSALVRLPLAPRTVDGRFTTPPTIEFRLPDGSAHPHLLLAGVAQAMVAARGADDLSGLLERTATARLKEDPGDAERLPKNFREVGEALAAHRWMLEAGGVFSKGLLDNLVANLLG